MNAQPIPAVSAEPHPYLAIEALIREHSAWSQRFGLVHALQVAMLRQPEVAVLVKDMHDRIKERLTVRIEELKQLGRTWPNLDTKTAAWAVLTLVFSCLDQPERQSDEGIHRLTEMIVRMVFRPEYHQMRVADLN